MFLFPHAEGCEGEKMGLFHFFVKGGGDDEREECVCGIQISLWTPSPVGVNGGLSGDFMTVVGSLRKQGSEGTGAGRLDPSPVGSRSVFDLRSGLNASFRRGTKSMSSSVYERGVSLFPISLACFKLERN